MITELMEMAFKCYAYEEGLFDFSIKSKTEQIGNGLTLYCMMDNEPDLDSKLRSEGWIRYNITGSNRILQIQQGFMYEVQVDYYRGDLSEQIIHKKELENKINNGHKIFLAKVLSYEKNKHVGS